MQIRDRVNRVRISVIPDSSGGSDTFGHRLRRFGILPVLIETGRDHAKTQATQRLAVQDTRTMFRLTYEQGFYIRETALRLKLSKTTIATYLFRSGRRARTAGRFLDSSLKRDS